MKNWNPLKVGVVLSWDFDHGLKQKRGTCQYYSHSTRHINFGDIICLHKSTLSNSNTLRLANLNSLKASTPQSQNKANPAKATNAFPFGPFPIGIGKHIHWLMDWGSDSYFPNHGYPKWFMLHTGNLHNLKLVSVKLTTRNWSLGWEDARSYQCTQRFHPNLAVFPLSKPTSNSNVF